MITKSELIEYLKHTPENTNYNILRSSLYNGSNKEIVDEFIEVLSRGNLSLAALQPYLAKLYEDDKTISPDPLPPFSSGGSSVPKPLTYDYMPEGYPKNSVLFDIEWDGNTDGLTSVIYNSNIAFYKVSDIVPTNDELSGGTFSTSNGGEVIPITSDMIITLSENLRVVSESIIIVQKENATFGDALFPQTGTYFYKGLNTGNYITRLSKQTITPMSAEFIPESVATKSDVEAAQTTANAAKNTAESAQDTANAAAAKKNPVFTGSFSQNRKKDSVIGYDSHAEGISTIASGQYSHAEGDNTIASGESSHAEGNNTTASEYYSHAEGFFTTASGSSSHAEGGNTTAKGRSSHAEGYDTKATSDYQHVQGKFNIEDSSGTYAHIVGNGESSNSRSNAHTLDWSGNAWFAGTVEGTALIIPSSTEGSTKKFKITVDDTGTISATEVTA